MSDSPRSPKRREVLSSMAGLTLGALAGGLAGCTTPSTIARAPIASKKGKLFLGMEKDDKSSVLRLFDWDRGTLRDFEVPLTLPHSVVQMPSDPSSIYVFECFGSAAKMNLTTGDTLRFDNAATGEMFGGHATLNSSADMLVSTQLPTKSGMQWISIRDMNDLKKVERISACEYGTHQLLRMPGSNVLAWGDTKAKDGKIGGGVTFFDLDKRKVINRIDLGALIIHLAAISPTQVLAVTCPETERSVDPVKMSKTSAENMRPFLEDVSLQIGPLHSVKITGETRTFWDPKRKDLFNFNFGIAPIPGGNGFVSSHVKSNRLFVWKDFAITKELEVPHPRNVAVSEDGTELMALTSRGIEIYSIASGQLLNSLPGTKPYSAISGYKSATTT